MRAEETSETTGRMGLKFERRWTSPGVDAFDQIEWQLRSAVITGSKGELLFEQRDVEVPASWSQLATNVVVSKYFRGGLGTPDRETSVRQLIGRVVSTIVEWAAAGRYLGTRSDLEAFGEELKYALVQQYAAFNSPVWFNVGVEPHPQCSACFINSVEDSMDSILDLAKTEGRLFKYGSGTGTNFSTLRGSREQLKGGGTASGPVSFMRGFDAFAGVIKSGGKTRRAAKMVILDADHPDVVEFVNCKAKEEKKAGALIDAGYDGSLDGEAYGSVFFQNSNNSVRVTDEFMRAVERDGEWNTINRCDGSVAETMKAKDLMMQIAQAAHACGDPGLQFDTTVNAWHTCKATDRIYASNPCSEYMFLNDTACNLASLNLMKFKDESGAFDVESFKHAIDVVFTAQEVIIDNAAYPTDRIAKNSHLYRTLGLGYANLGALLMAHGLPYDSDEGRAYAAAVTAIMTGEAYAQSARIAKVKGPFQDYARNADAMLGVMQMHRAAVEEIDVNEVEPALHTAARLAWDDAILLGKAHGYRNAQATVLAPTGTIGFMMDCDTTGIEPDIALIKYKKMVGGGLMKFVNNTVPASLEALGYDEHEAREILAYLEREETIEGAPHLAAEDLAVYDCAFKPAKGSRSIAPMGHIKMMAATQPFLSGAISKTVNLSTDATVEEIADTYLQAWKLGLKAVAVYRDGCKRVQPLNTSLEKAKQPAAMTAPEVAVPMGAPQPTRRRLPDERTAVTHKFSVAGHEGYITAGLYEDGMPGEVFITMSKEGSTISGLMDSLATSISLALQYGVPLQVLVDKFSHTRYEPSGFTGNPQIPIAKSVTDYIFRWLALKFLATQATAELGSSPAASPTAATPVTGAPVTVAPKAVLPAHAPGAIVIRAPRLERQEKTVFAAQADAPICHECGSIMVRNGACYKCANCGSTSGCS